MENMKVVIMFINRVASNHLRWFENVKRMSENRLTKKIYLGEKGHE